MVSGSDAFDLQLCPLYVEDGEEESLAAKIDVQQLRAKQEILDHVARLRDGFEARSRDAAAAAEQRTSDAVAAKQAELNTALQQLQDERTQHRTAQASLDRMLAAYDAIQHVRQYHMLARRAFCGWLGRRQAHQRKRQRAQRAATHRDLLRLQGKPLLFWLHWTRVERHARAKAAMERGLEHERAAVRREADMRLAAMQARVDRAEAIAAHEVALRRDTEEKLKYAFMRHVATLNLEAQEIVQQHASAEQQPPAIASARTALHPVRNLPVRQDVRMAGQPLAQHAADPAPAASRACDGVRQAQQSGNSDRVYDWQPISRAMPRSAHDASRVGVASRGLTPHAANADGMRGAPSAPPWQQLEPEPVGRALQIPQPMQHIRAQAKMGGNAHMHGAEGRMHVLVKSFQHPQVALTVR